MSRLELVVMPLTLSPEEARALLDQYAEGELDEDQAQAVEACLDADPELQSEYRALVGTLEVLRGLPPPEPPEGMVEGMVARVRGRLAQERAEAMAAADDAHRHTVTSADAPLPAVVLPPPRRGGWLEVGLVAAAACALAVGIFVANNLTTSPTGDGAGVGAAGMGATAVSAADLVVVGVSPTRVQALAAESGLVADSPDGLVFEGDRPAALRFRMALLAEVGGNPEAVDGLIPEGDHLVLRVTVRQ